MIPGWQMEAYEILRTEIVRSAVKDLRSAMRKSDRLGCVCDKQKALEAWFLSDWGQLLCENRGEHFIEQCRDTHKSKVPVKGKQRFSDEEQQKIYHEYKNGMKYKDILKKYKISSVTLYRIMRRWEI